MKRYWIVLVVTMILSAIGFAQSERESTERRESHQQQAPRTMGQQLVEQFVATHSGLASLEIAFMSDAGCKTVAASAPEDIGEECDADELGPIRTGKAEVEAPSNEDPIYDITQALHDSSGNLIGAVGMDLKPDIGSRDAVVAHARQLLNELEAKIPSKAWLSESAGR
ncbi:MAG: hypothetical protein P8020_06640 [Acidobacteriota bacterium]